MRSFDNRELQGRIIKRGDLLLEKSGGGEHQPVGAVVLYDHDVPAVCSNFVARMPVAPGFSPRYLAYLHAALYSTRVNVRSIKQSTGIQNLDSGTYLTESAAFPDSSEQTEIARFLDRQTAKIDALVAKKERLIELLQDKRMAVVTASVTGLNTAVSKRPADVRCQGEIPSHWRTMFLDKVVDPLRPITYGIVQPGTHDPEGILMVRGQNYSRGWSRPEDVFRVSPAIESPFRRARLKAGDLVMTIVGAGTGNVAIVPAWLEGANITQTTARIAINPRIGDARFFAYQLQSLLGKSNVDVDVKGAAQPGLTLASVAKWRLLVPPLQEQLAIAEAVDRATARLDALASGIAQAIRRLCDLRVSIIFAAVTGKMDVRGSDSRQHALTRRP